MIRITSGTVGFNTISTNVVINSFVPERTFVIGTARINTPSAVNPDEFGCTFNLIDSSTVRVQRGRTAPTSTSCIANYFVVECTNGEFKVTNRAACSITLDNLSVDLSSAIADPSRTMIIWSESIGNGAAQSDTASLFCSMHPSSLSRLIFNRNLPTLFTTVISYQIVEWAYDSGVTIVSGYNELSAAMNNGINISIGQSINPSSSWFYGKYSHASNGLSGLY